MKKNKIRSIVAPLVLLAGVFYASASSAHVYNLGLMFDQTTQVLTLNCPAGTDQVRAQVLDVDPNAGFMTVTVFKDGSAASESDLIQGDGTYGDFATLAGGAGTYYLIATQTAPLFGGYFIQYHCETSGGIETTVSEAVEHQL